MRKLQAKTRVNTYLTQRASISTRHIDWPTLSLEFAAKAIRKSGHPSKFTLSKLIYGKYDDSQYKDAKEKCPMCNDGQDDRNHLLSCRMTQHLWDIARLEHEVNPVEQVLCQLTSIPLETRRNIRNVINRTIQTDSLTRLGIFN